jgi:hypothetical protein
MSVSRRVPRNSQRGGLYCCSRHSQAGTKPKQVRPDFREPGIAMGRFNPLGLFREYGQASGLRCYMFATAAVYAPTREAATAFADANDLRGPA